MATLLEFASERNLTLLLIKERSKCRRSNRNSKKDHSLDRDCDINSLLMRQMLSRMMPPRYSWIRPKKREKLSNGENDTRKNAEKALLLTINRDRNLESKGKSFKYLKEMDAFFERVRERLSSEKIILESPKLKPTIKSKEILPDGTIEVICRPLSVYTRLEDKIILALTNRYLTRLLDKHLHKNILAYRPARRFYGKEHRVTDFNDGIRLINQYLNAHRNGDIFVADCDIKKFFDIMPHNIIRECFTRILKRSGLDDEGESQVMRVINAYLRSYNFYSNVLEVSNSNPQIFAKMRRRSHNWNNRNCYRIDWVDELLDLPEEEKRKRGIPQGGALSQLIINVVLNDVDQEIVKTEDKDRLFIRYGDDMIVMHTRRDECTRLLNAYTDSLMEHGLFYHDFESVSDLKNPISPMLTTSKFWRVKSHRTFLWGDGPGDRNRYIGFLGYEMQRDGRMRLRKSNVERYKEKFNGKYHAIYRRQESGRYSDEENAEFRKKTLDSLVAGLNFYEALDMPRFQKGKQYKYIEKLRNKVEKRLIRE